MSDTHKRTPDEAVAQTATLVASYYNHLTMHGVPDGVALHLTLGYQNSIIQLAQKQISISNNMQPNDAKAALIAIMQSLKP